MMTERQIQLAMYFYRAFIQPFPMMLPNVYYFGWESDLLYVSRSGYLTEFEIKVTRSDYLADANKVDKHKCIPSGTGLTRFYYCCPTGLIDVGELPPYAGLFYIDDYGPTTEHWTIAKKHVHRIKASPKLEGQKLSDERLAYFLRKAIPRMWKAEEAFMKLHLTDPNAGERMNDDKR